MDYNILWFVLIVVLFTGFFFLEGFDYGVGTLLTLISDKESDRSQIIRSIGPVWDGNEVWLLTAGGATFAAFPEWYATMFSGMYLALFLVLTALIVRVMALEWRSKVATEKWRFTWDWAHTISAWLVPLLLGVAFANFVQGMKIEVIDVATGTVVDPTLVDQSLSSATHQLTGGFFSLLTPFTILGGLAVLAVCLAHGAQFLALKTTGDVHDRANAIAAPASIAATVLAAAWLMWGQFSYTTNVLAWIPLVVAALAIIASTVLSQATLRREGLSFVASSVAIAGTVAWVFASMAPAVQKSSINPAYSLTIDQASSTTATLTVMTIVTVCLLPIVLAYVIWSYWTFRSRVGMEDVTTKTGLLMKKIRLGENFLAG